MKTNSKINKLLNSYLHIQYEDLGRLSCFQCPTHVAMLNSCDWVKDS